MNPRGRDRGETTDLLRAAAVEELIAVGHADFAMEGVARRAFFSIGSVYNRWPDSDMVLADVVRQDIAPALRVHLDGCTSPAEAIEWTLGPGQRECLLLGEALLASRAAPLVRSPASQAWRDLRLSLARVMPDAMAWYVAAYAVGNALLGAIGVQGPNPACGRVAWFADACVTAPESRNRMTAVPPLGDVDVPLVPIRQGGDPVSVALISAARALLAEHGAAGTSTREIAASAGVTTGALYRRFEGKSGLLADVLLDELQPDRYAWTWDLVRALASEDPFREAATVLAARTVEVSSDQRAQAVLLQLGIAARNDDRLRREVSDRIMAAHRARVDMAGKLASMDLLRVDTPPDVLTWGFQAVPVGIRATQAAGIALDAGEVTASMEALLRAAARSAEGDQPVV